ncbi:MAG: hypothetical protein JWO36_6484 [Myxococcales bacterium]|nr:hypothetical protein [Myxococcales bacterium]
MESSLAFGLLLIVAGCGDNYESCPHDQGSVLPADLPACGPAQVFVTRDISTLTPSQAEVDRYFHRWQKADIAEPILVGRFPQKYRGGTTIYTKNPQVIAAWTAGQLITGDQEFDQLIAELHPSRIDKFWHDNGDGSFYFLLLTDAVFNEEVFANRLSALLSWTVYVGPRPKDDGYWSWPESSNATGDDQATAQVDFKFGWGDCFVSCFGFHSLRIIMPAVGEAVVYDLGGDPLPEYLQLSPNTKPL